MNYPNYTERAVALVTATLAVHLTDPDDDHAAWIDAKAALQRMHDGELTEDGTVDPVVLKVVLSIATAMLRVLAQETDQDPEALWARIALRRQDGPDSAQDA